MCNCRLFVAMSFDSDGDPKPLVHINPHAIDATNMAGLSLHVYPVAF